MSIRRKLFIVGVSGLILGAIFLAIFISHNISRNDSATNVTTQAFFEKMYEYGFDTVKENKGTYGLYYESYNPTMKITVHKNSKGYVNYVAFETNDFADDELILTSELLSFLISDSKVIENVVDMINGSNQHGDSISMETVETDNYLFTYFCNLDKRDYEWEYEQSLYFETI
ncbi:MAG: hypothetical protein U0O22_02500 [Acutalibacteraceae bacterium]